MAGLPQTLAFVPQPVRAEKEGSVTGKDGQFFSIPAFQKVSTRLRQQAPQCENTRPHSSEIIEEIDQ